MPIGRVEVEGKQIVLHQLGGDVRSASSPFRRPPSYQTRIRPCWGTFRSFGRYLKKMVLTLHNVVRRMRDVVRKRLVMHHP